MKRTVTHAAALVVLAASAATFAADSNIRLNSLGFIPWQNKHASINTTCSKFTLVKTADNSEVYTGTATGPTVHAGTGENIYLADFSTVTDEGTFYLDVEGVGKSPAFPIGYHVYDSAYYTAMRGMYLARCGCVVSGTHQGNTFKHASCHMYDAFLDYYSNTHETRNSTKGWHDAGDYNKYTVNAGITLGMLFDAWRLFKPLIEPIELDIPESKGALPDFLAELKWETDWLLTMQFDDGKVSHKISTKDFGGFILPNEEITDRYFVPWGSAATADFVAMMAMAARYFEPYDTGYAAKCLAAAQKSYDFLAANTADVSPDQTGFSTGTYYTRDPDDRLWAAAEMWETTGESKYLTDFETRASAQTTKVDIDFDWSNVKNLGMYTYLLSSREGRRPGLYDSIKTRLMTVADTIAARGANDLYGRTLTNKAASSSANYYWGCNGSIARQTMVLQVAYRFSQKKEYLNACLGAIGHLFGRNYYNRSFVTGIGINPPMNPHDRRSGGDNVTAPWPGYLTGGAWPAETSWVDDQEDYKTNEIAINWQGALVFALAGFANAAIDPVIKPGHPVRRAKITLKKNIQYRILSGNTTLNLPAGIVDLYDSKGRRVKRVVSKSQAAVNPATLGLGPGILIVKSTD
jgi:endoglucanase